MIFINIVLIIKGKKWFINTENIKYRFFHPWYEQKHATSSHSCIITRYLTLCYTFCNTFLEFLRAQIFFVWSMYICSLDYDDMTRTFFFYSRRHKTFNRRNYAGMEMGKLYSFQGFMLPSLFAKHFENHKHLISRRIKKKITTFWAYAWLQWP